MKIGSFLSLSLFIFILPVGEIFRERSTQASAAVAAASIGGCCCCEHVPCALPGPCALVPDDSKMTGLQVAAYRMKHNLTWHISKENFSSLLLLQLLLDTAAAAGQQSVGDEHIRHIVT